MTDDLRRATEEFEALLSAPDTKERQWQSLFTRYPEVLASSLPVRVNTATLRPAGRPGRSEADFVFHPSEPSGTQPYGVIELKRPRDPMVSSRRKDTLQLSSTAMTAVAQGVAYARALTDHLLALSGDISYFIGNQAYIFVLIGMSEQLRRFEPNPKFLESLSRQLPANCSFIPYDRVLESLTSQVEPSVLIVGHELPVAHRFPTHDDGSPHTVTFTEESLGVGIYVPDPVASDHWEHFAQRLMSLGFPEPVYVPSFTGHDDDTPQVVVPVRLYQTFIAFIENEPEIAEWDPPGSYRWKAGQAVECIDRIRISG